MYRKNLLRKKLQAGEKLIGTWHVIPDPVVTEILSLSGLDFVLVDNEHGPGDVLTVANQLRAANGTDTTLVVRIPWNDHVMIKKLLDVGVESIMVPMVENAEEAEAVVSAVRYPPRGIRGIAHTDARASEYGFKADEYLETVSDNTFVICQVESAKAANNIEEIVKVDGLDMIF
ncbi:MAG: aldolase/citrate lyase family protein, partial [Deltaproteobacteria bacterium]